MAKHQSTKARLSEEIVKRTLEKYERKKLIVHLASVRLDSDAVDRLVEIMRHGGLPLIKHPNPTAEAKRASCVTAIETHLETELGASEADKVRTLMALIARIEQGYRQILTASDASPGAQLDPHFRVSALLEAGAREVGLNQERILSVVREAGFIDGHGMSLPGQREGERIDPEVPADSIVQSVTMSLLMQGYRHKLFDADGVLQIAAPVAVEDADIEAVQSILYFAQSWRFWEYIEEDSRYFGGDIASLNPEDIPQNWREEGVSLVWHHSPESLSWSLIDLTANQRLAQQLGQNYFEVVQSAVGKAAVGISGTAALAPAQFISAEEMHSLWALRQALSIEPTEHRERYFDLTLVEWLRGYSALRALIQKVPGSDAEAVARVQLMPRRDLVRTLQRLGLRGRTAEAFIKHALLCRSSRDLFDTPLIAVEDDQILLYGPGLAATIPAQAMLSRLSSLKQSFEIRGRAFEDAMLALMRAQGLQAVSVEERHDGETYDFDLLVRWDPYVFLFECKSRSLSGGNKVRSFRFMCETNSQIKQVKRLLGGLQAHPDILERHLGTGASQLELIPCVLNALPFAAGELDGIYFCDASGVGRLFESGQFNNILAGRDQPAIRIPSYRLWAGNRVAPRDLMRQLASSPQWRMTLAEMRRQACFASLGPGIVASTDRMVRHPLSHAERVAALLRSDALERETSTENEKGADNQH